MKHSSQMISAAAGALLLSACQTTGARLEMAGGLPHPKPDAAAALAGEQLSAGKMALAQGNYAAAVSSLRIAAMEPGYAAEAHNAIGVAYGRIGRHDLAGRYFKLASAENPIEEKYRDNHIRALVADLQAKRKEEQVLVRAAAPEELPPPSQLLAVSTAVPQRSARVVALLSEALRPVDAASTPRTEMTRASASSVALVLAPPPTSLKELPMSRLPVVIARREPAEKDAERPSAPPSDPLSPTKPEPRTAPIAMAARVATTEAPGPVADAPRQLAIQTSGRMISNGLPANPRTEGLPTFAEVFAPVGRGLIQSRGLVPREAGQGPVEISRIAAQQKLALADK